MVSILEKSGGFRRLHNHAGNEVATQFLREDRWHSQECTLCGVRVKNESAYRAHVYTALHQQKLVANKKLSTKKKSLGRHRVVVICDTSSHHSAMLPFRELAKKYTIKKGGVPIFKNSQHATSQDPPTLSQHTDTLWELMEIETLELPCDAKSGLFRLSDLEVALSAIRHFGECSAVNQSVLALCVLSAASNVTGCCPDMQKTTELIHTYSGIACWDLAALAAHKKFEMNPTHRPNAAPDFAFVSTHKLLGGPGCPGILLAKKKHLLNTIPGVQGGGVVFFVSEQEHSYISNSEEREEAGTPDILG